MNTQKINETNFARNLMQTILDDQADFQAKMHKSVLDSFNGISNSFIILNAHFSGRAKAQGKVYSDVELNSIVDYADSELAKLASLFSLHKEKQ